METVEYLAKSSKRYFLAGFLKTISIILVVNLCSTGCALIKLREEVKRSLESTSVVGRVYGKSPEKGPIIVAACSADGENAIAHYTVLHDVGEYELMVDQGAYYFFAYQDKNSNLRYDAGEPAGQYGDSGMVRIPAVGAIYDIDIVIPEAGRSIVVPAGTEIASVKPEKLLSRQAGAIADLDDERFDEENGIRGFWEPMSFYKEFGGNIFFLEEYDPDKIPILFIHGATGTPKGWKYFVEHIDRTRFQPWFFYYPTGVRIDSMANLLFWKLINLQSKYQFNEIFITAHSMGGLVARSFLVNFGGQFPYVKLLISLATPWGGDKMAEYGVKQSPAVVPSWIDMQPEGDFIKSLYNTKMPESVDFYMFSGIIGSRNPFRSNNDGTIALSSIQDFRPQSEAKMNYVFNEDHASIIYSKEVLARYNTIINEYDEKQSESPRQSGGHLKVRFKYSYPSDGVREQALFVLRPEGGENIEAMSYLSDYENGKLYGPFTPGKYRAVMLVSAGRSEKADIPVTIVSGETRPLDFVFKPDGVIRGYITTSMKKEEKAPGRPDIIYQSVDDNMDIQSISLTGEGIERTLKPMMEEGVDELGLFIYRTDFCYKRNFAFFGLPAGDYSILIKVKGYQSFEKKYSVTPGVPKNFKASELIPDDMN